MKTSKKKMVSILEDRYKVIKYDFGYNLYDKTRNARYANYGVYVATIQIDNGVYMFNDNEYTDVNELSSAIDTYIESLPFTSEIYDPTFRKHVQITLACDIYLKDLGFELSGNEYDGSTYVLTDPLTDGKTLSITVDVDKDKTSGKIVRNLSTHRWIESHFEDLDSAIGSINSLISTEALMSASHSIQLLDKMNTLRSSDITMNTFSMTQLKVETQSMREWMIEMLENELKGLKKQSK